MNRMICCICKKGPLDGGISVYRINEKGVPGMYACADHIGQTDGYIPKDTKELVKVLERK